MASFPIYITNVDEMVNCRDRPNHCAIVMWGQKNRPEMLNLEKKLEDNASILYGSPVPSINEVKQVGIVCVQINQKWFRARIIDNPLINCSKQLFQAFCLDYGFSQQVPLTSIRLFPKRLNHFKEHPALASKHLLGDVLVEKIDQLQVICGHFLKLSLVNQMVCAVHLGYNKDYEGIRLYTGSKCELLAQILVEKNLGTAAETYLLACKQPPPKMSIPSFPPTVDDPSVDETDNHDVGEYTSLSFDCDSQYLVSVSAIENGVKSFYVHQLSPEFERTRIQLNLNLISLEFKLKALLNPTKGKACIVLTEREQTLQRGLIRESRDKNSFNVLLVDQGSSEIVPLDLLFEIPHQLLTTPLLAIHVSLAGVDDTFGTAAADAFTKLAKNLTFIAKVSSESGSSPTRKLDLFDSEGHSVKDLILSLLNKATVTSGSPLLASDINRLNFKIPTAEVEPAESLFVTFCDRFGHFYGQFDKRATAEFKGLDLELFAFYGGSGDKPLLYADVKDHIGDYGILKWAEDNKLYRVEVMDEFAGNEVLVMLVDYGNLVQVPRCKIWAPVIGLQLFTLPPFGVRCQVENVPKVTLQQWQCALFEKPLRVIFDSCFPVNGYFTVHLPDCMVNSTIIEVLKDYGQISLLTPSRYDQPLFFQFPSVLSPSALNANDLKIPCAGVGVEESLFITYCDRLGHFYGQFDKRATAELKALEEELFSFYGKNCNKVSLYADHENHVGDPAVIKWAVDKQLYRIEILEELQGKKVLVMLVDYGNVIEVSRRKIWAPVSGLEQFALPPFGVNCLMENVSHLSFKQWQNALLNKPLRVRVGSCSPDGRYYTVFLPDCMVNATLLMYFTKRNASPFILPIYSSAPRSIKITRSKIPVASVEPEEVLLVTHCDRAGHFFGQFDRRPTNGLIAMENELAVVYADLGQRPLLYAGSECRVGDIGVIKWIQDGKLYRVEIIQEVFDNQVLVMFADYGDMITVPRNEILAADFKFFTEPPFGINCRMDIVPRSSAEDWKKMLMNRSVWVKMGPRSPDGHYYTVSLIDCFMNAFVGSTI